MYFESIQRWNFQNQFDHLSSKTVIKHLTPMMKERSISWSSVIQICLKVLILCSGWQNFKQGDKNKTTLKISWLNYKKNPYITSIEWSSTQILLAKGGKHGRKTVEEILLIIGWSLSYTDTRMSPRNTSLKIRVQYARHAKRLHYVKWVLPALIYLRVEMDKLKEKVL